MAETTNHAERIVAAVRELATADVLAFGGVGTAGQLLPVTEAYQVVEDALPERADDVRRHLGWLLANGSAAGKAYAATLLGRFDAVAARTAWESLVGDRSEFTTFSGCLMDRATLGEYVAAHLDQG